jgi:hypothetical protein
LTIRLPGKLCRSPPLPRISQNFPLWPIVSTSGLGAPAGIGKSPGDGMSENVRLCPVSADRLNYTARPLPWTTKRARQPPRRGSPSLASRRRQG